MPSTTATCLIDIARPAPSNPLVDMDDQFYWLVGRSWWAGAWPIVDIWDRKPVGLFLLYTAIAGIDRSILAVQIASLLFAAGTAILIRTAALHSRPYS